MIDGEDAVYLKNLEGLVKSRTDQLVNTVAEVERLQDLLKKIQTMETVGEIRQTISAMVG